MRGWLLFIAAVVVGAYFFWPDSSDTGPASSATSGSGVAAQGGSEKSGPGSSAESKAVLADEPRGDQVALDGRQDRGPDPGMGAAATPTLSAKVPPVEGGAPADLRTLIAREPGSLQAARARLELARQALARGEQGEAKKLLDEALASGAELANLGAICLELARLTPEAQEDKRRLLFSKAVELHGLTREEEQESWTQLEQLNNRLIFSRRPYSRSFEYEVRPGDSLWKLSRDLQKTRGIRITTGMLQAVNELGKTTVIQPGRRLKVLEETLRIVVEKKRFKLTCFLGDCILKRYGVGLGKGGSTPEGVFTITSRLVDPPWIHQGQVFPFGHKENVLGTRWLGFEATRDAQGLGIHGTWEPASIGQELSNGCIRLRNADVEELFDLIPEGTKVEVRP
ncbi:MAG: L,D-transpeptidase family protein [Planctomycetota bacterium]